MRVTNNQLLLQNLQAIRQRIAELQLQVSSGKRLLSPSHAPADAARIVEINQAIASTEQFQTNANLAAGRLSQEQGALTSVGDVLQRVRELALVGRNTHLSDQDRRFIAAEVRVRLDELVGLANARDGNGEYLFAGSRTDTQPFSQLASGQIVYNGDQSERRLQIGSSRQIADGDPGHRVFMAIRNGNGTFVTDVNCTNTGTGLIDAGTVIDAASYQAHSFRIVFTGATTYDVVDDTTGTTALTGQTYADGANIAFNGIETRISGAPAAGDEFSVTPSANQSMFETLNKLIGALESGPAKPAQEAQFGQAIDRFLSDVDQAQEKLLQIRAAIGSRLNAIDSQKTINENTVLEFNALKSSLEDTDFVAAVSELSAQAGSLEAAQRAFVVTQNLSLFNFISP
jgi:flagellar hook-associated protein 3 FlgL